MVLWAAAALLGERITNRRHIRQRYRALTITKLTHLVRNLLLIHAAPFARRQSVRPWRDFSPSGFQRRRGMCRLRAIAGSRLRRALNDGDLATRLKRFVDIVRNLDAYTQKFLVRRARNGLSRLSPLIATHPQADALPSRAAQTPAAADSS